MFTEGHRVMGKLEFVQSFCWKVAEVFMMADYVREMTEKVLEVWQIWIVWVLALLEFFFFFINIILFIWTLVTTLKRLSYKWLIFVYHRRSVTRNHKRYTKSLAANGATCLKILCDPILSIWSQSSFQSLWPVTHLHWTSGRWFSSKNGLNRLFFTWLWTWMWPILHENMLYSSAAADEAIATRAMYDTSMENSSSLRFSPCLEWTFFVPATSKSPPSMVNKL